MSAKEFMGWMAYANVEPFGEARDDLRFAVLTHRIALQFGAKKGAPLPSPADFLLDQYLEDDPDEAAAPAQAAGGGKARTPGQMRLLLRTITAVTGGKFITPNGNTDNNDRGGSDGE